jgi:hypothetical protein
VLCIIMGSNTENRFTGYEKLESSLLPAGSVVVGRYRQRLADSRTRSENPQGAAPKRNVVKTEQPVFFSASSMSLEMLCDSFYLPY